MAEITSPTGLRWAAVAMFAIALYCIYLGAATPPGLDAPSWVMFLMSIPFAGAGISVFNRAAGVVESGAIYGFVFLLCFGIVFAWIPFGGHPESCTSTSSLLFWISSTRGSASCSWTFGVVGWLMIAGAVLMGARWVRSLLT